MNNESGLAPISWAALTGLEAVVKPYLEKVAQPVTEDKTGQRLLSSATPHYKAMVKLLLENDAEKPNHSCQRFYIVYIF